MYISIQVSYTSQNGFVKPLVMLNNSLQMCKSISRLTTMQSQFVTVQFRIVFSFRKWLANTSNIIIGLYSLPPVISQSMKQPNMAADVILQSITVLQAAE